MKESSADRRTPRRWSAGPDRGAGHYRWKIFYVNPEDEAFFVPMRYGGGMDFNYARWPGELAVVLVAVGVGWALLSPFV